MLVNIKHGKITLMTKVARILTNDLFFLTAPMRIHYEKGDFDRLKTHVGQTQQGRADGRTSKFNRIIFGRYGN